MTRQEISNEVKASFDAWFVRNFLDGRAGRIGGVSYTRAGSLDDDLAGTTRESRFFWYVDAYERGLLDHTEPLKLDEMRFLLSNPLVALQLALGVTDLRGLRCYRRGLTAQVNRLQQRSYRARYYARDNERRRRLAAERRRITRRRTLNPCPTPKQFLETFERRGESIEAKIRFGGMVHDLECYVDNCLKYDGNGEICGRNGGIKAWIANNLPQLNGRYKTIMRYKALAKRLRQAAEIPDPVPTSAVYDCVAATGAVAEGGTREHYAFDSHIQAWQGLVGRLAEAQRTMASCGNVLEEAFHVVDAWLSRHDKMAEGSERRGGRERTGNFKIDAGRQPHREHLPAAAKRLVPSVDSGPSDAYSSL